jgi:hypothetical protein
MNRIEVSPHSILKEHGASRPNRQSAAIFSISPAIPLASDRAFDSLETLPWFPQTAESPAYLLGSQAPDGRSAPRTYPSCPRYVPLSSNDSARIANSIAILDGFSLRQLAASATSCN